MSFAPNERIFQHESLICLGTNCERVVGKPEIEPFGRDWRYIPIALTDLQKGEWKAQDCDIAWSIKGNVKKNTSPPTGSGEL
jgi:hypothetical protein